MKGSVGTCQQDMGTWVQAEHSRKWEAIVLKVKGMEGSFVEEKEVCCGWSTMCIEHRSKGRVQEIYLGGI